MDRGSDNAKERAMLKYEYQNAIVDEENDYEPSFEGVITRTIEGEDRADAAKRIAEDTLELAKCQEWPIKEDGINISMFRIREKGDGTAWQDAELHRFGIETRLGYYLMRPELLP